MHHKFNNPRYSRTGFTVNHYRAADGGQPTITRVTKLFSLYVVVL